MKDHASELRLTETNSAEDSAGRTWGLEGNLFWYVVAGIFVSVLTLLLCFSTLRWSFGASTMLASVPLTLSLLYVFGFRQGKPAGYDRDLLDGWLHGTGFAPNPQQQPEHPLHHDGTL
jgi:hypothetical protein